MYTEHGIIRFQTIIKLVTSNTQMLDKHRKHSTNVMEQPFHKFRHSKSVALHLKIL